MDMAGAGQGTGSSHMSRLAFFIYWGCLAGSVLAAQPETAPAISPEKQAFRWFDGLGFPSLKGCKLVRVVMGWSQFGNDPPQTHYDMGFVVKDDGKELTVFTTQLYTTSLAKAAANETQLTQAGYEPLNLAKAAATLLENLRKPNGENVSWSRSFKQASEPVETFVMARACAANGLDKLAREIYDVAAARVNPRTGKIPADFRKFLCDEMAYSMTWRAVLKFEYTAIPRMELLDRFRQLTRNFPESKYAQRAKDTVELLSRMVREDQQHAKRPAIAPNEMTTKQRVAELIFQLRDQNGHQWSQPGECDIFSGPGDGNSPAHQLVKIGYDAIPQLIEVLGDERFSRSVGYHRDFYFSHYVLRVGDCAQAIISRIAGRRFYRRRSTSGAMVKDGQVEQTRRDIQAWWSEFQTRPPQSQPSSQPAQPSTRPATGLGGGVQEAPTQQALRRQTIGFLKKLACRFRSRQEYDEALEVVEQILTIDPSSCWAANEKQVLIEFAILMKDVAKIRKRQTERARDPNSRYADILWYSFDSHGDGWKKLPAADRKEPQPPLSEAAIRHHLKREIVRLSFADIDLRDVLTFLSEYSDIKIQVNWQALGQVGIKATRKISMDYRNITVKRALDLVLTRASNNVKPESEPRYVIQGGVLLISTKAELEKVTQARPPVPQSQPAEPQSGADHLTKPTAKPET